MFKNLIIYLLFVTISHIVTIIMTIIFMFIIDYLLLIFKYFKVGFINLIVTIHIIIVIVIKILIIFIIILNYY